LITIFLFEQAIKVSCIHSGLLSISQVQHLFFEEKPAQVSSETREKRNYDEPLAWLARVSAQDQQARFDSTSTASFARVPSRELEDSGLLQITPFLQKLQTKDELVTAATSQYELPQSTGNLTRELADLSLSSVLDSSHVNSSQIYSSESYAAKNINQDKSNQKHINITSPHGEFDFSKDFTSNSRLGLVGRTVRFVFAHFIDLTLVVVSLLVSLVSGFFVFVFDPTLEIPASLQFSRWLPVRLVTELNLVEAFLFFYVLCFSIIRTSNRTQGFETPRALMNTYLVMPP
jgi:hypothetical protein